MMRENKVKKIIKEGGYVVGTFVKFSDPSISEILGLIGYDFFVLDNEHVSMNKESMVNIIRGADATDIVPIVRVRKNEDVEVLQALDSGALGVQVPNVDTAKQAKDLVSYVKYTPVGKRGFSPSVRAAHYGMLDKKEYVKAANENTLIVSHCETVECVNNLDEILKIPEIDVIFIGPMDLSQSLGVIGDAAHPKVIKCIDTIIEKTKEAGKAVGIVSSPAKAHEYIKRGVQYLLVSTDQGMIISTGKQVIKDIRGNKK
ncbi:HpcH/HpaI aldolase family protein [Maledivibacter halophilus]|uniref:4-hydroxy-2-oxoheptanedioate aldolase n=1 Tax=Maledivibacter halophilus TaxID=36842 RepID=A0A1T5IAZ1_9FIRM|nr:aldolase/citrate lyase family protein [Maledivibacter halophilus]SKC36334.1 4-hydroxy-2-oxoheptanedioate aldolase [Maledivibacter halophilus]